MNDNVTEQIARNLMKQVPSDKDAFFVVVDKETSNAAISVNMSEAGLVSTLMHIYKTISPLGRELAKKAIKNIDWETASQESGSLKINLN